MGRFSALFGALGLRNNSFSLEKCSKIVTFAISAQAGSSELQNPSNMVSETLSELPKRLPRAPREVLGASRRPLRSGPRHFQRHLSSAEGLPSTLEVALKAFRDRFWCKLRAPSLLFFLFSFPLAVAFWPRVVGVLLLLFDVASVLRATVLLAVRCYGSTCCFCSECQRCLSLSLQRKCKPTCKRRSHEATWGQIHILSD